jgi:hypothetical protein
MFPHSYILVSRPVRFGPSLSLPRGVQSFSPGPPFRNLLPRSGKQLQLASATQITCG